MIAADWQSERRPMSMSYIIRHCVCIYRRCRYDAWPRLSNGSTATEYLRVRCLDFRKRCVYWGHARTPGAGCRSVNRAACRGKQGTNDGKAQAGSVIVGSAADHFRLQRVWLDRRRENIMACSMRGSTPGSTSSTLPCLLPLAPRQQRWRLRGDHRKMAESARQPR